MDHPDAALIEQVVRQVLLRLAERSAASVVGDAAAAVQSTPNLSPDRSTLLCDQTVVSVAWLEQRWAGQLQIQFGPRAVVTPAARDWLRSKQIESIRA
ncbi:MAG: hypothetical protein ACKN94_07085, partial [Pirellulaceae bacterium]